jgi:hypothetical protein
MEGGIFNTMILNEKLNLITDINDKNLEIKGINFIIDNKKANKENFLILLSKLEDCLNPFFYTDYKAEGEKHKIEYRFKRFDSYKNGNEIDKYLFTKLHNKEVNYILNQKKEKDIDGSIVIKKMGIEDISKENYIQDIITKFNKTYTEATLIVRKTLFQYFGKRIKPIFGTWFKFSEQENLVRAEILGVKNYNEMSKMVCFINKLYSLIHHLNFEHIKKQPSFAKSIIFFSDCSGLKSEKQVRDKIKIRKEKNLDFEKFQKYLFYKTKRLEYQHKIKKFKKSKKDTKLKKSYENKFELYKTSESQIMKTIKNKDLFSKTQITKKFPHLSAEGITTRSQGLFPIGTGSLVNISSSSAQLKPNFIDFDYEREMERLREWEQFDKQEQQGGGVANISDLTQDFYENYYKKYEKYEKSDGKRKLENCDKTPTAGGYVRRELQDMLREFGVSESELKKNKSELCKIINEYIKKNKGEIMTDEMEVTLNLGDKSSINREFNKIGKFLDLQHNNTLKNKLLNQLSDKNIKNNYKSLISQFKLEKGISLLERVYKNKKRRQEIMINRIRYQIYKSNENHWTDGELNKFYKVLMTGEDIPSFDVKKVLIESYFKKYSSLYLESEITQQSERDNTIKKYINNFWEIMEKGNDGKGYLAIYDTDYETGEPGGIIKASTFNYFDKAISCPNYHKKYSFRSTNTDRHDGLVSFGHKIPQINAEKYQDEPDEIRKILCHPRCATSLSKTTGKTKQTITDQDKLAYLFCAGEIDYNIFSDIFYNPNQDKPNYVSTKIQPNEPNKLGKLVNQLHLVFNNIDKILQNKQLKNIFFKTKSDDGREIISPSFLLIGVKKGPKNIFEALGTILNIKKEELQYKCVNFIKNNEKLFNSLNQGMLSFNFDKKIVNYLKYIINEVENNMEWMQDLFSRPGLFHPKGVNIIVFTMNEQKELILKPPLHMFAEDYYDKNRPSMYFFEHSPQYIEPIILRIPGLNKNISLFDTENPEIFTKFNKKMTNKEYSDYIQNINNFLGQWYLNNYSKTFIGPWLKNNDIIKNFQLLTAKKTIEILKNNNNSNLIQLTDSFHKVIYILDDEKNLIPVKPSGYVMNEKIKYFDNQKQLLKYTKTYSETKQYLKKFIKYIENMNISQKEKNIIKSFYDINFGVLDRKNKTTIIAVELYSPYNHIMIPIKPESKDKFDEISEFHLEFNINAALKNRNEPKLNKKIIEDEFNKETYKRFLLEFAHYINSEMGSMIKINNISGLFSIIDRKVNTYKLKNISNSKIFELKLKDQEYIFDNKKYKINDVIFYTHKKIIEGLMKKIQTYNDKTGRLDAYDNFRKHKISLEKIIQDVFYKISLTNDKLLNNITKETLKNDKVKFKNRRRVCRLYNNEKSCNLDSYCKFDTLTNQCKIHIPLQKVNTIIGRIHEEFVNNTQNARDMLFNNVDTIIDRFLFEEGKVINNMIYRRVPDPENIKK